MTREGRGGVLGGLCYVMSFGHPSLLQLPLRQEREEGGRGAAAP